MKTLSVVVALKSLDIMYKSKADGLLEEKQILKAWVGKLETDYKG